MYAVSILLSEYAPRASLLSYWYAESIWAASRKEASEASALGLGTHGWLMLRGGYAREVKGFSMTPPSGATTDHILFIGSPVEAAEFANRARADGVSVDLLAVGITEKTPPVSRSVLRNIGRVLAPPETSRWLARNRVNAVEIPLPLGRGVSGKGTAGSTPDDTVMRIAGDDLSGRLGGRKLPFSTTSRLLPWRDDGLVLTAERASEAAEWCDVFVDGNDGPDCGMLDDPLAAVMSRAGVPSVSVRPLESLPGRMAEAARSRRAGTFGTRQIAEMDAGKVIIAALCGGQGGDQEHADEKRSDEACRPNTTVKLGIVIPFGGLMVDMLRESLRHVELSARKLDIPVIVAHQRVPGWNEDVQDVVNEFSRDLVGVTEHSSPSGWRLGLARNEGVKALPSDVTHVVFLDADVRMRRSYLETVQHEAEMSPDVVLTTFVRNQDGSTRVASGISIYPRRVFDVAGGFGESFEGWGYEDLDLLARLRRDHGVPATLFGSSSSPMLEHIDHEPRWVETRKLNWERYVGRSRGEICGQE